MAFWKNCLFLHVLDREGVSLIPFFFLFFSAEYTFSFIYSCIGWRAETWLINHRELPPLPSVFIKKVRAEYHTCIMLTSGGPGCAVDSHGDPSSFWYEKYYSRTAAAEQCSGSFLCLGVRFRVLGDIFRTVWLKLCTVVRLCLFSFTWWRMCSDHLNCLDSCHALSFGKKPWDSLLHLSIFAVEESGWPGRRQRMREVIVSSGPGFSIGPPLRKGPSWKSMLLSPLAV